MGLSETIVASIIGALATVVTAVFQLVRNRAPSEGRPKKNRMRSLLATVALSVACIVGGYAWSSLRAVNAKDELRDTMRVELKSELGEQFAAMAARQSAKAAAESAAAEAIAASHGGSGVAESLVHLPPCRLNAHPDEVGPVACSDRAAQLISLCAAVPSAAITSNVRVQARVPRSESQWLQRDAGAPTLGSLHISEAPVEYPVSADQRSVCLDVSNWSVEDTLAVRLIVDYTLGPKPAGELTAAAPGAATL
jgi:hypothetical protein